MGADQPTIHQLKGDMPSFNMKYGRNLTTNWLQRYKRHKRLSLICLVKYVRSRRWSKILPTNITDRLREMQTRGGEGVQNPENFTNVINGCPLTTYRGITELIPIPRNGFAWAMIFLVSLIRWKKAGTQWILAQRRLMLWAHEEYHGEEIRFKMKLILLAFVLARSSAYGDEEGKRSCNQWMSQHLIQHKVCIDHWSICRWTGVRSNTWLRRWLQGPD